MTRLSVWLLAGSLLFVAPRAYAQKSWPSASLPFGDIDRSAVAVVPGRDASTTNRFGAVFVFAAVGKQLVAQEWDLAHLTLLRKSVLGGIPEDRAVVAERWGDDIYVLTAAAYNSRDDEVILFTLDASLAVRSREVVGHGTLPSLATNDRYVVMAFHEKKRPLVDSVSADGRAAPAALALHVAVRDRATKQIVGARMFQGDELLYTTPLLERSMHAIALDGDRATLAMTGLAKVIVTSVSLPSLRDSKTVRFGGLGSIEAAPIFAFHDHQVLVDTLDAQRVLDADLLTLSATSGPAPLSAAGENCARDVPAWRSRVAVCGGTRIDGGPAPVRLAVRRYGK